ncbi:MAG: class I SAM-dependent methyltransferase [Bacillota bacterium]|nr:class I SAM-dependent methyltransferase [Bacillota bacterium]
MKKTDYGNWVPAKLLWLLFTAAAVFVLLTILLAVFTPFEWLVLLFGLAAAAVFIFAMYMGICRHVFAHGGSGNRLPNYIRLEAYDGVMGRIHHFLVEHLDWDGQGELLDIGCGSGALTIRCALKYPEAKLTGMDYWGWEWSYAKKQCERNATAEGVADRIRFVHGDAARLDFETGRFDCAVSNFVFHEVKSQPDKTALITEALRVVRKGGAFAFQDLFCQTKLYGDMDALLEDLKKTGIQEIHFIPNVEKLGFIPRFVQAPWMIYGIGLLYGIK